jgi:ketosteroid isomerase-like protein
MESSGPVRDTAKAMSQENVEVVRQAYAAFDRLDMEALLALLSDDFELDISAHPIPDFPNVGVGRDHVLRFFATYLAGFSDYNVSVADLVETRDDRVVALLHDSARLGDATVERDLAHIWTLDGGSAIRVQVFDSHEGALEAAGLSE